MNQLEPKPEPEQILQGEGNAEQPIGAVALWLAGLAAIVFAFYQVGNQIVRVVSYDMSDLDVAVLPWTYAIPVLVIAIIMVMLPPSLNIWTQGQPLSIIIGGNDWAAAWATRLKPEEKPVETMQAACPRVIPRNHRIEEMIAAAVAGDYAPFERLMAAYADPFGTEDTELMRPPTKAERVPATFCGT